MRRNPFAVSDAVARRVAQRTLREGVAGPGTTALAETDGDITGAVNLSTAAITEYGRLDWTPLTETAGEAGGFVLG